MKVAIVHDWLVTYGGADRVLEQMLSVFPDAKLFSLVDFLEPHQRQFILEKTVQTSFLQNMPFSRRAFRNYLPIMPLAIEQFDLSGFDLVISSSHSVAKGAITGPDQLHICYCHTPMRYAWDLRRQYLREGGMLNWPIRWILHKHRTWDVRSSFGVDEFIANSQFIARRIWKTYRRNATVIFPPVDVEVFVPGAGARDDFYLTVSRLVPYKQIKLIVEAFAQMPDKKLIVIGDGPHAGTIKAVAGSNVTMLGYQDVKIVRDNMQRAKAFLFAAEEDFGISVLEAQACGTPVIAYGKGGVLETVRDFGTEEPTGIFFPKQSPEAVVNAVALFERERSDFQASACRDNALRFSVERFCREFSDFCYSAMAAFRGEGVRPRPKNLIKADLLG